MAKKLTQDEIKTIYSIEATDAQKKLHELKNTNKELSRVMETRRKEMVKMEVQGKKNTAEYKNLEKAQREDAKTTRENTQLIREQEKAVGINAMSMNQLRSRARALRGELNNLSKELNPERWDQVNKELSETNDRMRELRGSSSQLSNIFSKSLFSRNTFAVAIGNIYAKIAQGITRAITKAREFISTSTDIAAKAQGIDHAFNRIANRDYLKSLREQTKGLVSDFTLMQSAVRAENFDIPLSQLGKYLLFAQNRARDTGENIDYLVESIINGIGRKSPLILDNLGISLVRIQEETKKTGDFATAVGNIIDDEMSKAGESIDAATDSANRKKVAWENIMLTTGKFFTGFRSSWDDFVANFLNGLNKILSGSENAVKAYDDQINKVAELDMAAGNLADRYDVLSRKTKLNESEQSEVNRIMNQLIAVVPEAAGEFDEYGNILSVNTVKVREYIAAERARIDIMREAALKQAKQDVEDAKRARDIAQSQVDQGGKMVPLPGGGTVPMTTWVVDTSTLPNAISDLQKAGEDLKEAQDRIDQLSGAAYERQTAARYQFNQMNFSQLKEWIEDENNAKDEFITIAKEIYNTRYSTDIEGDEDAAKSAEKSKTKYELELQTLNEYIAREKALIQQKYTEGLISREQYDRELEYLEIERLQKNMDLAEITFEQQQEFEFLLFEKKKEILQKIEELEKEHLDKLAELQKKADEQRMQDSLNTLKKIAEQNQINWEKEFEAEKKRRLRDLEISQEFGGQIGEMIGGFMSENENVAKSAAKSIVMMSLDLVEAQAQMAAAQAAGWSFAQPDSIMSLGATGAARAAIMAALIKGAFTAVKSFISSKWGESNTSRTVYSYDKNYKSTGTHVIVGKEVGGFIDVTRKQDKKRYIAKFDPTRRGFVNRPTVIVGDGPTGKSAEWVASNDALRNPTIAPFIKLLDESQKAGTIRTIDLNHIMRTRMAGFESGGFISRPPQTSPTPSPAPGQSTPAGMSNEEVQLMREVRDLFAYLKKHGIPATVVLSDMQREQEILNKSQKIGSRS